MVVHALAVFVTGLLAGEELIVRWGVQPALRGLGDAAHLEARQALVRRLKVVVPMLIVPAVVLTVVSLVLSATTWRWAGAAVLLVFVLTSAIGTVPINIRVDAWDLDAPPDDWREVVRRWERIDVLRSSAAVVAFASLLAGLVA
ncbi:anthrone oxygenase family protein [Pseudonocardia endophytica]|uniref:Uncharacterized protein DUF1772 n=1 Tax=Pseudonocardia endophytica TaxID=401976 RepID=A0A4R1HWC6_PSEEN|nr:DUF1772 domain-containing protein [Pseudonocardia endophytica]TCK26638.1 uncharacterized protein DUF1772 [Pseudonocardia endophytica]